jgi:carbohydrate kinase (thermoresistant glucokinase family)
MGHVLRTQRCEIRSGRLQDPVVRDRLRAGLDQFIVDGLPAAYRDGFRDAMAAVVRARRAPVVVMGVSGCGKTTVGEYLAESLRVPFVEGDGFHPASNLESLHKGVPLDDRSRSPWLAAIEGRLRTAGPEEGLVVTCSALRRIYRELLRAAHPDVFFVHLALDEEQATARVAGRTSHVMPASLVPSQFKDLEPLEGDEAGMTVDAILPVEQIVAEVQTELVRRTRAR